MVDPQSASIVMITVIAITSGGRPACGPSSDVEAGVGLEVAPEVEVDPGVDVVVELVAVGVEVAPVPRTTVICVVAVLFWLVASKTVSVML